MRNGERDREIKSSIKSPEDDLKRNGSAPIPPVITPAAEGRRSSGGEGGGNNLQLFGDNGTAVCKNTRARTEETSLREQRTVLSLTTHNHSAILRLRLSLSFPSRNGSSPESSCLSSLFFFLFHNRYVSSIHFPVGLSSSPGSRCVCRTSKTIARSYPR